MVGRWVRGRAHYGRERLTDYLLTGPDNAIWLVGTRRMGKTSMLRQLELIADQGFETLVPVVWDMQGCEVPADLSAELVDSLVDVAGRFAAVGIEVGELAGEDAPAVLRTLARRLADQGKQLFVLIDEAEALLNAARLDPAWVGRLRRALQDSRLRTVITSTKLLARLDLMTQQLKTSPFLFGFSVVALPRLEDAAARALVRQQQSDIQVRVDDREVDDILIHTNGQPYLIQLLCHRLFESDDSRVAGEGGASGRLRQIGEADLAVDHVLSGLFRIDYQHLSQSERRILLAVAELTIAKENELLVRLSDLSPHRIRTFLYGLERAGLLRQVFSQWAVGNEFLRRWLADHQEELVAQLGGSDDDNLHESMLESGRRQEAEHLRQEIKRLESRLEQVDAALRTAESGEQLALLEEADRLRRELARLRKELASTEFGD